MSGGLIGPVAVLDAMPQDMQDKVRGFVNDIGIPRELECEENPEAALNYRAGNMEWAKENGLWAMTLPKEQGGGGLSFLEQVIVNEQGGRATNGQGFYG